MLLYLMSYGAGLILAESFSTPGKLTVIIFSGLILGVLYVKKARLLLQMLCWFALGIACMSYAQQVPASNGRHYAGQHMSLEGIVLDDVTHKSPERSALTLKLNRCQQSRCTGKVKVFLKGYYAPVQGQKIKLTGQMALPQPEQNFAGFSYRKYLKHKNIHAIFYARTYQVLALEQGHFKVLRGLQKVRYFVLGTFEKHLPYGHARLVGSLILGESVSAVPDELKQQFQALGLQHVLAVSGFQVQLVVLSLLWMTAKLRCSQPLQMLIAIVFLWLFVLLTGSPASVLRAAAVATGVCVSRIFYRKLPILDALTLGVWGLLLICPLMIWDIGFQFSAVATLGLIVSARPLSQKMGFLPLFLSESLGALFAAQMWVLPLQLFHFGTFAWLFLPGNLWSGFLTSLLTWFAIVGAVLSPLQDVSLFFYFQNALYFLMRVAVDILLKGMDWMLCLSEPVGYFPRLALVSVVCLYGLISFRLFVSHRWGKVIMAGLCLSLLTTQMAFALQAANNCPVRVTYLSVGQGDATLIEAAGKTILIDAGPRWKTSTGYDDAGSRFLLPYLRQRGIAQLDLVILSHAHLDHYGGLESLAKQIKIKEVRVPAQTKETNEESKLSKAYLHLLTALKQKKVRVSAVNSGSILPLDSETRLVFWQPLSTNHGHNDGSVVVQLFHQQVKFFFAGDLEKEGEMALLEMPGFSPAADILKVPHHGSSTSSSPAFIAAIQPQDAIVSVGERNRFRHPSSNVVNRYQEARTDVWRTDQSGAICICSQGKRYQLTTVR